MLTRGLVIRTKAELFSNVWLLNTIPMLLRVFVLFERGICHGWSDASLEETLGMGSKSALADELFTVRFV